MTWLREGIGLTLLVAALAVAEGACRFFQVEAALADEPLDIQTPNQLLTKLNRLQQFEGTKVVLIGDSVIYGGILKDFGDAQWRDHTLTPLLKEKLAAKFPGRETLVMNLGINGALPADIECLTKLVVPCKPDVVILSTHLRPFSADFATAGAAMARSWLRDLTRDAEGTFHYHPAETGWGNRWNHRTADCLRNRFTLFRNRDTIQTLIAQDSWPYRLGDLRRRLNGAGPAASISNIEQDPMILLLQFKKRFSTVSLDEHHWQVKAWRRTLEYLKNMEQKTVVFYVKENPDQVDSVIEEEDHKRLYDQLIGLLHERDGPHLTYVAPIAELEGRHFLDLSHLTHEGYRILAKHLWNAMPFQGKE